MTEALTGRATFRYIAFDVERGDLVYMKDFWHVDHPEIQKERDVYHRLHEALLCPSPKYCEARSRR